MSSSAEFGAEEAVKVFLVEKRLGPGEAQAAGAKGTQAVVAVAKVFVQKIVQAAALEVVQLATERIMPDFAAVLVDCSLMPWA